VAGPGSCFRGRRSGTRWGLGCAAVAVASSRFGTELYKFEKGVRRFWLPIHRAGCRGSPTSESVVQDTITMHHSWVPSHIIDSSIIPGCRHSSSLMYRNRDGYLLFSVEQVTFPGVDGYDSSGSRIMNMSVKSWTETATMTIVVVGSGPLTAEGGSMQSCPSVNSL
jgi:hypothetical protein